MSFRCPQCKTGDALEILTAIELPPDRSSQEIALQVVVCETCPFRGLAVYQESRHNMPESESWQHVGYWVSPDAVESVKQAIESCPDRHNPACRCPAHTSLGQKDVYGMWRGLLEMQAGHTFAMRLFFG